MTRQRSQLLSQFNTQGLTDELRRDLQAIIDRELDTVREREAEQARIATSFGMDMARKKLHELMNRETTLTGLPQDLGPAVDRLRAYDFLDQEAQRRFNEFVQRMEQLLDFARNNFFRGDRPMSLADAQEMMERLARLDKLMADLESGNLEGLDLAELARLLGQEARESMERFLQFMELLKQNGYIVSGDEGPTLTPRAMALIGQKALRDIFSLVGRGSFGPHRTTQAGQGSELPDETRPHRFGDPFNVHLTKTVMNAVLRSAAEQGPLFSEDATGDSAGMVQIRPQDFEIKMMEQRSSTATVLMLDMSLSMFQGGRFGAAKKVALALEHLIRTRFPRDHFFIVAFATTAREMTRKDLLHAAASMGDDIFTNIQDGLKMAGRLLAGHRHSQPQIIMITDGQPTAFAMNGKLHVEWPTFGVSPTASRETLKEVRRITGQNITINTFMLDREPALVRFVEQMTKINRGRAFFTTPQNLGKYLLLDYMGKKKRMVH